MLSLPGGLSHWNCWKSSSLGLLGTLLTKQNQVMPFTHWQAKKLTCDLVWELGGYTKWNMTWSPGSHLFSWHLGWLESLNWWQGTRISTQWGECTCEWGWGRGSRLWGCRISWTKWHHEWLFELTRRHSWCHLVQVILHPQRLEPHPQLPFTGALPSLGLNPYALPPLQGFEPS